MTKRIDMTQEEYLFQEKLFQIGVDQEWIQKYWNMNELDRTYIREQMGLESKQIVLEKGQSIQTRTKSQKEAFARIMRQRQRRYDNPRTKREAFHVSTFQEETKEISKNISIQEAGLMMFLILHTKKDRNGYLFLNDETFLTQKDIIELTKIKERTVKLYLKHLQDLGIIKTSKIDKKKDIYIGRGNKYQLVEKYHVMGKHSRNQQGKYFTKLYINKASKLLKNLSLEAKGLLYMMIPYVHYQVYAISDKPNQDLRGDYSKPETEPGYTFDDFYARNDIRDAEYLTKGAFMEDIGWSKQNMNKRVKELVDANVLKIEGEGVTQKFYVNPELFGRDSYEKTDERTYANFLITHMSEAKKKSKR